MEPRERPPSGAAPRSRVIHRSAEGWHGIESRAYKDAPGDFAGVTRHVLASPADAAFELRYFELEPGGRSSHERHRHVHVVVCLRGSGRVRLGEREEDVSIGDVVVVASGEPHRFSNPADEPFGFLCIVDRDRDRPIPIPNGG